MGVRVLALLLGCATLGCGAEDTKAPEPEPTPEGCEDPFAMALADGTCFRPGIEPEDCAPGFEPDGGYGCVPVLPAERCPPGLVAVPGDESCRPLMDCGDGPWPLDLPNEPGTQYVDGAFVGTSDGSAAMPWTTIPEAVAAAPAGATIAVAAGTYTESVEISGKAVTLWGRCPDMVTIDADLDTATCPPTALCVVQSAASGTVIRGVALTGSELGLTITGVTGVQLDRVRIHDTGFWGLFATGQLGPPELAAQDLLVEGTTEMGVYLAHTTASFERTVVRGTLPSPVNQGFGRGFNIQPRCNGSVDDCEIGTRSTVALTTSVVEDNHDHGLFVVSSDFTMDRSVVRGTLPTASSGFNGRGLALQGICGDEDPNTCLDLNPSLATVNDVVLEDNHEIGLFLAGSELTMTRSVVRDTRSAMASGRGVMVQPPCVDGGAGPLCYGEAPAVLSLSASLVDGNRESGVMAMAASAALEGVVVRATQPLPEDGTFGHGVVSYNNFGRGSVSAYRVLVDENTVAGVASFGADVALEQTRVRCSGGFALSSQPWNDGEPAWDDRGDNLCGCPDASDPCKITATSLEPPNPL